MKVFIAGATGVLGRRVVLRLIAGGHRVVGLSRSERNDELLARMGAESRRGDLFNKEEMILLSAGCEAVLHLATAIPTGVHSAGSDWAINDHIRREGTAHLLAAAEANQCRLYLQQSVTFLYGDRQGEWVDESSRIDSRQPPILQSALDMENAVRAAMGRIPCTVLRFGSFYCHDSSQTASMFDLIRARRFPVIGRGNAYWNIINADDAADAVVWAVERCEAAAGRVLNVCDNEPVLLRDLIQYIADVLSVKRPRTIPKVLARLILGDSMVRFLLSSARCRNDRAREQLGWSPNYPTYREGMSVEAEKWKKEVENGELTIEN